MIDGFSMFGIGLSRGSSHSLFSVSSPSSKVDYLVGFHLGLEGFKNLLFDLVKGIERLELFRNVYSKS